MKDNDKQILDDFAAKYNIQKTEGGVIETGNTTFDGMIPLPLVNQIISLTRKQSQWLEAINTITRNRATGNIPVIDYNEPVTEGVGENEGTKVTHRPPTRKATYACKKFKSEFYITTEELREAREAGIPLEEKALTDWATQLGNDVARIVMQSNTALDTSTRENRMLRMVNGVDKVTTAGANVYDAQGKAWGVGMYDAMVDYMPDRFAEDPNLQWMYNRRVNNLWYSALNDRLTRLGDSALTTQSMYAPLGIKPNIVPQIKNNTGPTAIAPTSVSATGEVVLTTWITADAGMADVAAGVGRKFIIVYLLSGLSETLTAYEDTTRSDRRSYVDHSC